VIEHIILCLIAGAKVITSTMILSGIAGVELAVLGIVLVILTIAGTIQGWSEHVD
jgi:hypothetical protein